MAKIKVTQVKSVIKRPLGLRCKTPVRGDFEFNRA
jgi:hypothetical protein